MRCAQAGGPPAVACAAPSPAASPPIELMVDVPPVAWKAALLPALKLDFILSAARDAALADGAARARGIASGVMEEVRAAVGFLQKLQPQKP